MFYDDKGKSMGKEESLQSDFNLRKILKHYVKLLI